MMHRVLVVVFDDETKAHEGEKVLLRLDNEGSITVSGLAILAKNSDGTVKLMQKQDFGPLDNFLSTPLGSVIALLGGPAGLAISAATGFTFGETADAYNARLGEDFVDDVRNALLPGKVAVLSEIGENWTASVDVSMEQIGGIVFRRSLSNVRRTIEEDNLAAMQADIDQLKAEQSLSDSDRTAELQRKINQLDSKIHAQLGKAEKSRAAELQAAAEGIHTGTSEQVAPRTREEKSRRHSEERICLPRKPGLANPAGATIHDSRVRKRSSWAVAEAADALL